MGISASFCPFFGHFRSLGPSLLLSQAREVILMGPRTGNAQKTGKTWQKYPFFSSTMEIARNLKISMLQLAIDVGSTTHSSPLGRNTSLRILGACSVSKKCTILDLAQLHIYRTGFLPDFIFSGLKFILTPFRLRITVSNNHI